MKSHQIFILGRTVSAPLFTLVCLVLWLPERSTASTLLVTNMNDSGFGSLRQEILLANSNPGPDFIDFGISGTAPFTITLFSPLPAITDAVTIDSTTQPGYTGTPIITIDTNNLMPPGIAFTVAPGVNANIVGIRVVPQIVPEPSTALFLGAGLLIGIAVLQIRQKEYV